MASRKGKPQKTKPENQPDSNRAALWTQLVITVGTITVAAIAAYQAIKIAQIGVGPPTAAPTSIPTLVQADAHTTLTPVQRIEFDYEDSPIKHGWEMLSNEATEEKMNFEHTDDQFVGKAISISSTATYAMEFRVRPEVAQRGKVIELVAKLTPNAYVFTHLSLLREDGSTTKGWLKLTIREGEPKRVDDDEWQIQMKPFSFAGGEWRLYRVDLEEAVMQTFGHDHLRFRQLEKLRVRGNLSLDHISVYELQP